MQYRWMHWWSEADRQLRNLLADDDTAASLAATTGKIRGLDMDTQPFMSPGSR